MSREHALERDVEPVEVLEDGSAREEIASDPPPSPPLSRLGGARADFVAALGRRVAELLSLAQKLEDDPASAIPRDDLRRRVHALAAGARLLRFTRLAERLGATEQTLASAAARGSVSSEDLRLLREVFDQLPALAWGEASAGESTPAPGRAGPVSGPPRSKQVPLLDSVRVPIGPRGSDEVAAPEPQTALVVGSDRLADALAQAKGSFEVERAEGTVTAIDLARAVAPDVIVLDADRPGSRELCEALASDPLTEATPIVVVGLFARPDEAAPFVALGAARTLPKPVSPDALRRACADATATYVRREIRKNPLGEVSVDDLGTRLAEELRRGICDAAVAQGRGARFDLGEGSEVLAALWGAVARIRDVVTIQSQGAVRFAATGPEGALPIAPWIGEGSGEDRAPSDARGGAVSLDRKVCVVADDDPAVTWFLAGVLRAKGAIVHEAHDGQRALEIAHRVTPDLVITDVVMPLLDGFALCRALKRDLVLRDVPVILLSWKEDLLQRVRELGSGADGYLRKEASAPVILQRVREVMRPRRRVEERLAQGGEVRGRVDGLTSRTLLGLVCATRPDATLTVRDTAFLYEIDIRDGRPVRATRTTTEGSFEGGAEVLAALLGVGSGRFAVTPAVEAVTAELSGSLDEQLLPRIAAARAAQRLLSGSDLVTVERVELSEQRMSGYLAATPEPARTLLRTLSAGASPRALITSGQAAARLVEDVLSDAAAHGAVTAIIGANGEDLLASAIVCETEILHGARGRRAPITLPVLDLGPVIHTSTPAPVEILAIQGEDEDVYAEPPPAPPVVLAPDVRSPIPPLALPLVAPVAETIAEPLAAPVLALPDLAPRTGSASPRPASVEETHAPQVKPLLSLGSLTPPPVIPAPPPPKSITPKAPPPPVIVTRDEETPSRTVRRPSSFAPSELSARADAAKGVAKDTTKDAKTSRSMWGLFAVAGVVFAVGARLSHERELAGAAAPPAAAPVAEQKAADPAPAAVPATPAAELRGDGESKVDPILPQEAPLRADDKVPPGQGMLEVVAGTSDTIWIDGTLVGNGPIVKRALAPRKDPYEIRVKLRGEERVRFAVVKESKLTRIRIAPPWSR